MHKNAQTECDVNRLIRCGRTFLDIRDTDIQELCRTYMKYKECVFGVVGCNGAETVAQVETQLARTGTDIKKLCSASVTSTKVPEDGTRFPGECNVFDIYSCVNVFIDDVQHAGNDSEIICSVAHRFVTCLNRLTPCIDNPVFTQAILTLEQRNLRSSCLYAVSFVKSSSSSSHGNLYASIASKLLFIVWMLKFN
ncbi:uncharacterized protein LOC124264667 [Haliotis rubra]|uniref:uncharacterized protein LOC124264667 n=1 Tax=Haliotis rubra TaxID=36100 RepID=UPI001EE5DE1F|nr:uncharacterized protein LOC124264667 [Haliotis rubra]